MTPERDDALTWDGDDDPTLDAGSAPGAPAALPPGYTAVGKGSDDLADAAPSVVPGAGGSTSPDVVASDTAAPMGNATLITIGVIGGAYALYTIGWLIGGLRLQGLAQYLVTDAMFLGSFWLAVLAPVIWFATVFLLTRRARAWVRVVWLVAGLVLLVPWPFVMVGAVGQ